MVHVKAAILAIGTEITTGQIVNRNAGWIAEKLSRLGVEVVLHEAVADDRPRIQEALEHCSRAASLLFVTGGLGPTTDDFTRDEVARWAGRKLEFHEPSWLKIQDRLSRLGIPVAPSNRQQCFFPVGSRVLTNSAGTADAFVLDTDHSRVWVLPGPPLEIATIWKECGIDAAILERLPDDHPRFELLTWECLGKSEAELGEITEAALHGSGLSTGYRAHRPYVEVKVWVPENRRADFELPLARLEAAIAPWVMVRGEEDLAKNFLDSLQQAEEIAIIDSCTGGLLTERLGPLLRKSTYRNLAEAITLETEWRAFDHPEERVSAILAQADEEILTLALAGVDENGNWAIGLREGSRILKAQLRAPYKNSELIDRMRTFAVEMALKQWCDWLIAR